MATARALHPLYTLVHEYAREPETPDSDAAAERDLDYVNRILDVLGWGHDFVPTGGRA